MVIKVYRCKHCDMEDEKYKEPMSFDEKRYCPKCGKELSIIICPTTFVLLGAGWAKDGYSKGEKK